MQVKWNRTQTPLRTRNKSLKLTKQHFARVIRRIWIYSTYICLALDDLVISLASHFWGPVSSFFFPQKRFNWQSITAVQLKLPLDIRIKMLVIKSKRMSIELSICWILYWLYLFHLFIIEKKFAQYHKQWLCLRTNDEEYETNHTHEKKKHTHTTQANINEQAIVAALSV